MSKEECQMKRVMSVVALGMFATAGLLVSPASAERAAPIESVARYEVDFMQDMVDHHAMATEMAQMCLHKAVHAELRSMCADIIAAQRQEIEELRSWLAEWYGVSHQPNLGTGDMMKMQKLDRSSGAEFEIRFMESMIRHHWKAIVEARVCAFRAYHDELVEMCRSIIAAQGQEIAQLETWLCSWYDRCRNRRYMV
jgi:uncharacterized protein (DUF305 family)